MAREEKLVIKLEERMKYQFQQYADKFGVTMSAMGAFVIGQWVDSQNRLNNANEFVLSEVVRKANGVSVEESLEALSKNPVVMEAFVRAMAGVETTEETKAQA